MFANSTKGVDSFLPLTVAAMQRLGRHSADKTGTNQKLQTLSTSSCAEPEGSGRADRLEEVAEGAATETPRRPAD